MDTQSVYSEPLPYSSPGGGTENFYSWTLDSIPHFLNEAFTTTTIYERNDPHNGISKTAIYEYPDLDDSYNRKGFDTIEASLSKVEHTPVSNSLMLARSEYWIECNDCLPAPAVTIAEQIRYGSSYAGFSEPQLLTTHTLSPGAEPGDRITVPSGGTPISSNIVGANPVPNQERSLSSPPIMLAVDANRDGSITFGGADGTSESAPFIFWVNNDVDEKRKVDVRAWVSDIEQDDYPQRSANAPMRGRDHELDEIMWSRDLEDYTRLWVDAEAFHPHMTNPNAYLEIKLDAIEGAPAINAIRSYDLDGRSDYLSDPNAAVSQAGGESSNNRYPGMDWTKKRKIRANGTWKLFGKSDLRNELNMVLLDKKFYWLFEGAAGGKGKLTARVFDGQKIIVESAPLFIELRDIKDLYERWSVGDARSSGVDYSVHPRPLELLPGLHDNTFRVPHWENNTYFLHVHGWNMNRFEKDAYAETAYKRLWHQGFKGRFGAFYWPTFFDPGIPTINNFDASESVAWRSADGLKGLMMQLNGREFKGEVRVMGHSMGNIVVSEALRLSSDGAAHSFIACQAALAAHTYDANAPLMDNPNLAYPNIYLGDPAWGSVPYFHATHIGRKSLRFFNYHNKDDYALNNGELGFAWKRNQRLKPDVSYGWDALGFKRLALNPFNTRYLNLALKEDRYEAFAWAAPARSVALGATKVNGVFVREDADGNFDLNADTDLQFSSAHKFHSGQFRSTCSKRWKFWKQVKKDANLN